MKTFVACNELTEDGDFCWAIQDELVIPPGYDTDDPELQRVMVGLTSRLATTVFKVAEVDMTCDKYLDLIVRSTHHSFPNLTPIGLWGVALRTHGWVMETTKHLPVGAIVSRASHGLLIRNQQDLENLFGTA